MTKQLTLPQLYWLQVLLFVTLHMIRNALLHRAEHQPLCLPAPVVCWPRISSPSDG